MPALFKTSDHGSRRNVEFSWVAPTCRTARPMGCIQITIAAPHLRDFYEARCGNRLLPLRFEPDRISRHGTIAHVLLLVSSWRSWPASLTAMSLAVVPSLYTH
jgi:hypothetical protein